MPTSLKPITLDNFDAIIALEVSADQNFVASNLKSLAEAYASKVDICLAIYSDVTPVGFIMYNIDTASHSLWISRFMIDKKYQGKGYGKAALNLIKDIAQKDEKVTKLQLSTHHTNTSAIAFYENFGFVDTHTTDNDPEDPEEIFEFVL